MERSKDSRPRGKLSENEHAEQSENMPVLDRVEEQHAEKEESLNPYVTYEVIRREGEKELERPASAIAWAAIAGGLSMGFSFVVEALLRAHLPDTEWRPLVTKLGYPVGFLIISLASQQLFTENTITPVVPFLVSRTREIFRRLSILWVVVFVGNILGTLAFAAMIGLTSAFDPDVHTEFTSIGFEAIRNDFATTFIRAVFAGWLIALMVWMLPAASSSKVAVITLMTYMIGIGELSHIIVGSTEVLYLVLTGQASLATYFGDFVAPTLLRNVVGGLLLVTALNHAQVVAGGHHRK